MTLDYSGAGDGQCLALKADGERCTNGVYGSNVCCGTHKNASDVTLAPEKDNRVWFECPECGWQPADYAGAGTAPMCADCGVEFPPGEQWADRALSPATEHAEDGDQR